ncbi:MAG TPA: LysR substrate-binding domain-containing protein [Aestuariivirgaceae bacterium]|nr:LysR substrate-binding domain-containing protein [Aestuariivirgaceae bacterium]
MYGRAMIPNLDVDLLKTFIAIAETGGFTRAAEEVNKTQGAVSMQMRRLEDILGRPVFHRAGRQNRLTADGERLLDYARRIVRLNDEAVVTFSKPELTGVVRFGVPDDYADNLLPEFMARFARTHPLVQVDVDCLPSKTLIGLAKDGKMDVVLISAEAGTPGIELLRREPLVWVSSVRHCVHEFEIVPLAVSQIGCAWRDNIFQQLDSWNRRYRIAYASTNSNAIKAAVLAGLAVAALPRVSVTPGMRILSETEGFPPLMVIEIGLVFAPRQANPAVEALTKHIRDSLATIEHPLMAAE